MGVGVARGETYTPAILRYIAERDMAAGEEGQCPGEWVSRSQGTGDLAGYKLTLSEMDEGELSSSRGLVCSGEI